VPKRVLFVCTGNSCRSVMAQGLLQQKLKQMAHRLNDPVEVESAGVFAIEGMSPSKETLKLLQQEGVDMTGHMAKPLNADMIRNAQLILVMEQLHLEEILRRVPDAQGKVHLLKRYGMEETQAGGDPNPDIADPIGKPMEVYEVCFATIREAIERVAKRLAVSKK
jgi:protein-tyrosine-phosphatase